MSDPPPDRSGGMDRQSFVKGCLAGLVAGAGAAVVVMLVVLRLVVPESVWNAASLEVKQNRATNDMILLAGALEAYRADFGHYPTAEEGLATVVDNPEKKYIGPGDIPTDPWGRSYVYLVPGSGGAPFALATYGADGKPGGAGPDADLWRLAQTPTR